MTRHRLHQRATHRMYAIRNVADGEDSYGSPTHGTTVPVVSREPVVFESGGRSWVRTESGERVQRSPSVTCRSHVLDELQEGDVVSLVPIVGESGRHYDVEVASIEPVYGPRQSRVNAVEVELDGI